MSDQIQHLFLVVIRSSVYLAVTSVVVAFMISRLRIRSPRLQRAAWGVVLLQSCWLVVGNVSLPISAPAVLTNLVSFDANAGGRLNSRDVQVTSEELRNEASASTLANGAIPPQVALPLVGESGPNERSAEQLPLSHAFAPAVERTGSDNNSAVHGATNRIQAGGIFGAGMRRVISSSIPIVIPGLAWLWLIGLAVVLMRSVVSLAAFQWLLRSALPAREEWGMEWATLKKRCRIESRVELLEHDQIGPMLTVTSRGTMVVVPTDYWEELTAEQRIAILRHELAHLVRKDIVWSLLARLIVWPQWFNPFAWYALQRFDECAEWSCDEQLLQTEPHHVTDYARALIALVEFPSSTPFAARAAQGSSISTRIRRLLSSEHNESPLRKIGLMTVVIGVFFFGFIRFDLVRDAQAVGAEFLAMVSEQTSPDNEQEKRIEDFSKALDIQHDPNGLQKSLRDVLATETGRIVILERASNEENGLRQQAEQEPTPVYVKEFFQKSGDKYVVRSGKEAAAEQFLTQWKSFEKSLGSVRPLCKETAAKIKDDSEAGQLLKRFLADDSAITLLYANRIADRVDPDFRTIRERLNEWFVLNRDQRWVLRAGGRGQSEEILRQLERSQKLAEKIQREANEWRGDLSKSNDIAKAVHQVMADPVHACIVAISNMNEDYSVEQRMDMYFDNVESAFVDKAEGLVPTEERVEEIKEGLKRYRVIKQLIDKVRPHLNTFAGSIQVGDPLAERWTTMLVSDIGQVWLVNNLDPRSTDPVQLVRDLFEQWLKAGADGSLSVNVDQRDEVTYVIREWLKEGRNLRRRGREFDEFAAKLDQPDLAKDYATFSAKCLIARTVKDMISRQYYDGLGQWISNHFDHGDDGYTLKEGHDYEVQSILEQAGNIQKELARDDF